MTTPVPAADLDAQREAVFQRLERVIDPELGMSIIRLGLVYDIEIVDGAVTVVMTLTTRGCPLREPITAGVRAVLADLPWARSVDVRIVWDPPWTPAMIR